MLSAPSTSVRPCWSALYAGRYWTIATVTTATRTATMPRPTRTVQRRENGQRLRFRRGVRKSPGWVARLPEVTHSDWLAASLRGANRRGTHTANPARSATPSPPAPSSNPVGGEGLPAGTRKLVVEPVPVQLIGTIVWCFCPFSAPSLAVMVAVTPQEFGPAVKVAIAVSLGLVTFEHVALNVPATVPAV